jgi:hypothetical protein
MLFCRRGGTVERGDIHSDRKEFHSPEGHEDILAQKCSERLRMGRERARVRARSATTFRLPEEDET